MRIKVGIFVLAWLSSAALPVAAQYEWTSSRPDGHAPIGVMGDHTHEKGEIMLSYRFTNMFMGGNRTGTEQVAAGDILDNFIVSPLEMTMRKHMAGVMYAPSDAVTLMGMVNWIDNSMDHVTRANANFTAESSGLGDLGLTALVALKGSGATRAHLNLGLSIPTGSIEETGVNPMSEPNAVIMPYPMQLGSGTWDISPGLTVLGMSEGWSWGAQARGTFRAGENDRGYALGDVVEGTAWFAIKPMKRLSLSARVLAKDWGDYEGHDAAFGNPMMAPTVREDLRRGRRVDVPLGFNYYFPDGALKGHRLAAEWHIPVHQDLDGPQLETDWVLTIGWQKSFEPVGHD